MPEKQIQNQDIEPNYAMIWERFGSMVENQIQERNLMGPYYVPIWEKANLTVKEAAAYSGIGETSIREMLSGGQASFSFRVGSKWLINRELFDKYIKEICAQKI